MKDSEHLYGTALSYYGISAMPTSLNRKDIIDDGSRGWHESVLRSYHIVKKVRWLLEQGCSAAVVIELIDLMESGR